MIYKILADFTNCLEEILNKLNKKFNIIFFNDILYISKKNPYDNINLKKMLNLDNICIIEITESNLKLEPEPIINWCRDNFVKLDTIKFETEQQDTINKILNFIDLFDKNINDILKERGEEDG
jgi:hypothetical protein